MAQQRQLALSRQRNAVLSGLGVMANRDVPAGGPSPTSMQQHKSRLGRLLHTGGSRDKAYGKQNSMGTVQNTDVMGPSQSSPTETSPRPSNAPVSGADGIEICRLSTPLIASKQGVEAPSPSMNNQALWNLQAEVPQASPQVDSTSVDDKKNIKRGSGSWRPWQKKAAVKSQDSDTRVGATSPELDDNVVTEMIESLMESHDFEDARFGDAAWDNSHMTPSGASAFGGQGPAAEKRAAAVQPTPVLEVGEPMPGRPESPMEISPLEISSHAATTPKAFCRPEKTDGNGPPPFGVMPDPFDDLQEMLLSN